MVGRPAETGINGLLGRENRPVLALFSDFFNRVSGWGHLAARCPHPETTDQIGKGVENWIGEQKSRLLLNSMKN